MDSDAKGGSLAGGWMRPLAEFAAVWLVAMAYLLLNGFTGLATSGAIIAAGILLFGAVTLWIVPEAYAGSRMTVRHAVMAAAIAGVVVILSALDGLAFHSILPHAVPVWGAFRGWLSELGLHWFGMGNYLANPVIFVAVPLVALLVAGVRPPEVGLQWGRNTVAAAIVWALPLVLLIAIPVVEGQQSREAVTSLLVSNSLQNGFFEEFLFRGALQMALASLIAGPRAAVIAAVAFGLWHIGLGAKVAGGDLLAGLASTLVIQAPIGLGLGLLMERTGSLIAPSIAHVLVNSVR